MEDRSPLCNRGEPSMRRGAVLAIIVVAIGVVVAVGVTYGALDQSLPQIRVDGSSTVYPLTEAVAEEAHDALPEVRVAVGVSGTGGGMKRFCRGEIEIVQASRAMKREEAEECAANGIHFKQEQVAFDAIAVVVNPQNTWAKELTLAELKALWEPAPWGQQHPIQNWSDLRAGWPDIPIALYGPGIDSGTFDYFTKTIVGASGATRSDFTSSEDDNLIVTAVSGSRDALGYLGFSYFFEQRDHLRAVAIERKREEGERRDALPTEFVLPSHASVAAERYTPLTRPLYLYYRVMDDGDEGGEKPNVASLTKRFMEFFQANAARLANEVGLLPVSIVDGGI